MLRNIKNRNIISKLLIARIWLIIFGGLLLVLGLYDAYVIFPNNKIIESPFIFIAIIFFSLSYLLGVIINIILGLPWHGRLKKYSPEEIQKQNELLQSLIKKAERLDQ